MLSSLIIKTPLVWSCKKSSWKKKKLPSNKMFILQWKEKQHNFLTKGKIKHRTSVKVALKLNFSGSRHIQSIIKLARSPI